jgi:phosphoribosylpyrophosphate synthetase
MLDFPSHVYESYFPYSRQSKKKSHRGAITARMIANLLTIAGVDHVITLDLHVSLAFHNFCVLHVSNFCTISLGITNARILCETGR